MSLETAIQNLADELKRYNDRNDVQVTGVANPSPPKPEAPAKAQKPAKPAPAAAEPKAVTLTDALDRGTKFVAEHGRDALITIMTTKFKKPKIRDFDGDSETLAAIIKALDAYVPDPTA